ncbi:MAG: hypothetical protein NTW22_00375 [Proteobacteria bacterium]|jgi:hypothetical protein|nr:hypothetical protein [Pseudomonadota bacterium]
MNYLKSLMLAVLVAAANVSASTDVEELMGSMKISSNAWVDRAKAILPTVPCSDELRVEIASMMANLDVNQKEALDAMVTWFGAFMDAEANTDGYHFKKAVLSIFHPAP